MQIDVLSPEDGSRWVEDQIRYGLRNAWGEMDLVTTVVNAVMTEDLHRDSLWKGGAEIADALKAALLADRAKRGLDTGSKDEEGAA